MVPLPPKVPPATEIELVKVPWINKAPLLMVVSPVYTVVASQGQASAAGLDQRNRRLKSHH